MSSLSLDRLFETAAAEFDVPAPLLKSVAFVETRWQMVEGEAEFDGKPAVFGVMGLREDVLESGAGLAGVDPEIARYNPAANIRVGAALLRQAADQLGLDRHDLGAMAPAVAALSGIDDPEARHNYVAVEVYGVLSRGEIAVAEDGTVVASVEPEWVTPNLPETPGWLAAAGPDYADAVWRPSPNYGARPSGATGRPTMIVVHTCEGGYAGCWSWLRNSAAGASAHYVVNESGNEITQLVRERDRAWHVAAAYDCSRNQGHECGLSGVSTNNFAIGIEHAGFAAQSSFPSGQIEASARLVCDIARDHGIPRDEFHIVGHGQLQPWNRTDPGRSWPWAHYLDRVRAYCGDGGGTEPPPPPPPPGSGSFVVDSNNSRNDTARGYIQVSGNWYSSNARPGYYGTGYWWSPTQATSDPAVFWFYLDRDESRTIDAWWVAGGNRSTRTPFIAYDARGAEVGRAYVNQQVGGGRWATLGTWQFKAGWNQIALSRWTTGDIVVADAIQVR